MLSKKVYYFLTLAFFANISAHTIFVTLPISTADTEKFEFLQAYLLESTKGNRIEAVTKENYKKIIADAKKMEKRASGLNIFKKGIDPKTTGEDVNEKGINEHPLGEMYATNPPLHITLLGPINIECDDDVTKFIEIVTEAAKETPFAKLSIKGPTMDFGNHLGLLVAPADDSLNRLSDLIRQGVEMTGSDSLKEAYQEMKHGFSPDRMHISLVRMRPISTSLDFKGQKIEITKTMMEQYNFESKDISDEEKNARKVLYLKHLRESNFFRQKMGELESKLKEPEYRKLLTLNEVNISNMVKGKPISIGNSPLSTESPLEEEGRDGGAACIDSPQEQATPVKQGPIDELLQALELSLQSRGPAAQE